MIKARNLPQREKILAIAKRVRQWAEDNRQKYEVYCPSLMGMCAVASIKLWRELEKVNIKSQLCLSGSWSEGWHVYCIVNNHILDVTATQFGLRRIVIYPEKELYDETGISKFDKAERKIFNDVIKFYDYCVSEVKWPKKYLLNPRTFRR